MHLRLATPLSACLLTFAPVVVVDAARAQGAQTEAPAPEEAPAGEPPLPAPVTEQPAPVTPPPTPEEPAATSLSAEELARLKQELKAELQAELKQQMQAEMEAAARDVAGQRAASLEWEEERWVEEVRPQLNFLELDGYFRTRVDFFSNLDLGTYDPIANRGTSSFPVPSLYAPGLAECQVGEEDERPAICAEDTNALFSANMRLRLSPTLNVSEDIRVKGTFDILDNLVLGSTPEAKPGFANNPSLPLPAFSSNQLPPNPGFNTVFDAIQVKRLWAEVMTPFGQLRVGRQPLDFGLGILANAGEGIDQDYSDAVDQILFATRIAGHYIVPAYAISASGPNGRGGGLGELGDAGLSYFPGEPGQRYNLDPRDDVHTFILSVVKKEKEEDIKARLRAGDWVLNYGVFGVYRTQQYDIPAYYADPFPGTNPPVNASQYVLRNANAGAASLWARFQWDKLRIEAEAVGLVGRIDNTSTTSNGLESVDPTLTIRDPETGELLNQPLWVLQGGAALESSYAFLNDSLVIGLDAGIASGDDAPGFGLRPVIEQNPRLGYADGRQYGACLERNDAGECVRVDNTVTNYKFDPAYNVDLILFREILGTVTDAVYVKPHVAYYVTEAFGVRGDVIYSNALYAASTPGLSSPLGVEGDGTVFYTSDDGFVLMLQGGVFFPLGGFNHARDPEDPNVGRLIAGERVATEYLNAQFAYTLQALVGVAF